MMEKNYPESKSRLLHLTPKEYGEHYYEHLLKQYEIFVEMMDRVSSRRQSANHYFLTVNSFFVVLFGILAQTTPASIHRAWSLVVPVAGIVTCVAWAALINSYRQLNTGKFKIIHELETVLPAALFDAEWQVLEEGKGKAYRPFTHLEVWIPWVFVTLYVALLMLGAIRFFMP